jgi:hypothetical protein
MDCHVGFAARDHWFPLYSDGVLPQDRAAEFAKREVAAYVASRQ